MKQIPATDTIAKRSQNEDDLTCDDLKQYEADIETMNLILISIPNDIYNFMDASRVKCWEWWLNARRSYNTQEESTESSNVQKETGNVQRTLRTSSFGNATNVQCYNCNAKGHYARDCIKPRVRDSKYFIEQMLLAKKDEAKVILFNEQNDFLLEDAAKMEEIEELSVQTPSTSFMNPLFFKSDHEQTYHEQPKIINSTIADDQINSDIFDDPNVEINDEKVEHDKNAHDQQDTELELLARNAFKEAEKQLILAKKVKQILDYLHTVFKAIQKEFPEDVREMMNVFDSMESNLDETLTQNEILRDRLLEATLTHDVEKCVLMLADSMNDYLNNVIEKVNVTPRQGENTMHDEKGNHHNTLASI
ncbi:integrase, catalytic region, zinc finger, CCHC-type containing protein [Tanacetum coccineum]